MIGLFVGVLAAAALVVPGSDPAPELRTERARPASAFVDSIGANVHMGYNGTRYYEDTERVARVLDRIGIRHVRDGHQGGREDQAGRLNVLAAHGIRTTLIEDPRADRPLAERIEELRGGRIRGVEALEGPNELNTSRPFGDDSWVPGLVSFQRELHALNARHLRLPLLGPSFTNWQAYEAARRAGLARWTPIANIHPYPGGQPPTAADDPGDPRWAGSLNWHRVEEVDRLLGRRDAPWVATETGYHTAVNQRDGHPPASEAASGAYAPKLFLEYFRQGARRTFWYELVDQWPDAEHDAQESNFGLVRNDLTLKPAARRLQRLIASVSRRGRARGGTLRFAVGEAPADLQHLLLRRGDGSYALVLWRDTEARADAEPVRVELERDARLVVERIGARPVRTASRGRTVALKLGGGETAVIGVSQSPGGAL